MDDLLGEDWQPSSKPASTNNFANIKSTPFSLNFNPLEPQPLPARSSASTPSAGQRPSGPALNSVKPQAQDQFGSLLSLKSQSSGKSLSMQQRQEQLRDETRRRQEKDAQLWDNMAGGKATPPARPSNTQILPSSNDADDLLAAFNRSAPVNKASHFPPPPHVSDRERATRGQGLVDHNAPSATASFDDDDDPFGLADFSKKQPSGPASRTPHEIEDADDVLGELGKPVGQFPRAPKKDTNGLSNVREAHNETEIESQNTHDEATAELVDMGFPLESARVALQQTNGDTHEAVGWLLRQAHEESKLKAEAHSRRQTSPSRFDDEQRQNGSGRDTPEFPRREPRSHATARRDNNPSPAHSDRDPNQIAQDIGSKLFKSANSLWKASQKQMAKTMAEFQQDRDPSQPKWLQDATPDSSRSSSQIRSSNPATKAGTPRDSNFTDEAALLDAPRDPRTSRVSKASSASTRVNSVESLNRLEEPIPKNISKPSQVAPSQRGATKTPTTKLRQQEVEEQSAQAYISPARRRRPTTQHTVPPEPEVDLFSPVPEIPREAKPAAPVFPKRPQPVPSPKPAISTRAVPELSSAVFAQSSKYRKEGAEKFKRGDYAAAHDAYTAALRGLPATHPVIVIILCNRSLTAIKTGNPKLAVSDADQALEVIGIGQGQGETIIPGPGEDGKDMREFFGKALMRKAEALENMERWIDATAAWRRAVEAGVGGAVSAQGRDRCEKAAAPKTKAPVSKPASKPVSSANRPVAKTSPKSSASSREAVKKLRAANIAAERADDEKFALSDQVDARLAAWKGSKADNLRALLQSLDAVLWAEAGWKKVGMSDLVLPNKVKIIYMKAIAKVHPDKIPQNATTEQRMISSAVFSTLNEAWDKFKIDNNL